MHFDDRPTVQFYAQIHIQSQPRHFPSSRYVYVRDYAPPLYHQLIPLYLANVAYTRMLLLTISLVHHGE
jgi:hypothetical protein